MSNTGENLEDVCAGLKKLLKEAEKEAAYYKKQAEEVGIARLRETEMLSKILEEQKQMEKKLEESREEYKTLIRRQGEGFGIVDINETFILTNPAAEKIFGVSPGTLLGRNLKEFTDIKKWMEESGIVFNENNLKEVVKGIHKCVNKMWTDARSKLENCETFKNHYNGDTLKRFLNNLKKYNKQIRFRPSGIDFSYPETRAAVDPFITTIQLHNTDLKHIIK